MKVLIGIVFLTCCYSGEMKVTGSCLSYGHSCWGAHGKRSDSAVFAAPVSVDRPKMRATPERWAYIKLMQSRLGRDFAAPMLPLSDNQSDFQGVNNVIDMPPSTYGKMEKGYDYDSQGIDQNAQTKKHFEGADLNGNNGGMEGDSLPTDENYDSRHIDFYNAKSPLFRRMFN